MNTNSITLRPEYQAIVQDSLNEYLSTLGIINSDVARLVASKCQHLADNPLKQLTEEELEKLWEADMSMNVYDTIQLIIAAHIAKQAEPEPLSSEESELQLIRFFAKYGWPRPAGGGGFIINTENSCHFGPTLIECMKGALGHLLARGISI